MSQIIRRQVTEPWRLATASIPSLNGEGSTRVYTLRAEQINSFFLTLRTTRKPAVGRPLKKICQVAQDSVKTGIYTRGGPVRPVRPPAQGLFGDVYCGTQGVHAPGLIEGD